MAIAAIKKTALEVSDPASPHYGKFLSSSDISKITYAGAKFSSGALPPEMFYRLKGSDEREQLNAYWKEAEGKQEQTKAEWVEFMTASRFASSHPEEPASLRTLLPEFDDSAPL